MTDWFNICQKLSNEVYKDKVNKNIDGWEAITAIDIEDIKRDIESVDVYSKKNFSAVAYKKDKEIIIAYRGTDDKKDIIEDVKIAIGAGLKADKYAHNFADKIIKNFPDCKITFTGHSLGGAYAQLACVKKLISKFDCKALTYNAPGMNKYLTKKQYKGDFTPSKIENYVVMNDFVGNYRGHIGYTYYFQPFPMDVKKFNGSYETPHGCIRTYSKEALGGVVSKEYLKDFGSKNGLALWCFDTKNTTDPKCIAIFKKTVRLYDLSNAIRIIKNCSKMKLKNKFIYKSNKIVIELP